MTVEGLTRAERAGPPAPRLPLVERLARARVLGKSPLRAQLRIGEWVWDRLPRSARNLGPLKAYGRLMNALVRMQGDRRQFFGTYFLRNRPQVQMIRRLAGVRRHDGATTIAILGCSLGAEVYSIAWSVRSAHPDLDLRMHAVDISAEALEIGREGVYPLGISDFAMEPLFERMTDSERHEMFDREGPELRVKPWIKEGIAWCLGDAGEPDLVSDIGRHDIVVANDFLCHMDPTDAEGCLRNIGRLVQPGGYLVVSGVDLDVRTRVANSLRWVALQDSIEAIHDGDRSLRESWPWRYWGLEPLDRSRPDWTVRYASVFQIGTTSPASNVRGGGT